MDKLYHGFAGTQAKSFAFGKNLGLSGAAPEIARAKAFRAGMESGAANMGRGDYAGAIK